MNDEINKPDPDVLDEAVEQLREARVDESRLPAALETTRRALAGMARDAGLPAGNVTSRAKLWSINMMNKWTRIAAAAAVILVVVGFGSWFAGGRGHSGVVFADVLRNIQQARTVTYKLVSEVIDAGAGVTPPEVKTINVSIAEPDRARMEMLSGTDATTTAVQIWNQQENKSLMLNPKTHEATLLSAPVASGAPGLSGNGELGAWVTLRSLRGLDPSASERIGEQRIDGRLAVGFRIHTGAVKEPIDVWADAKTGRPLRVERTTKGRQNMVFSSAMVWRPDGSVAKVLPPSAEPGRPGFVPAKDVHIVRPPGAEEKAPPISAGTLNTGPEQTIKQTITAIAFDVPLDDSLFSVEVPEGYKLREAKPAIWGSGQGATSGTK